MDRWVGRVVLVTGASVGIGAAIVELLTKRGMKVVGCARDITPIQDLATKLKDEKGQLEAIKCDLRNESEILAMFDKIKERFGRLDVCINNAGLAKPARLLSGATADWQNMLDVNVTGLCIVTREAFKLMQEKNIEDGHIIQINSMSGKRMLPNAYNHFYSASKFAVTALVEGVRNELREMGSHIRISQISPGLVKTEFVPRARGKEAAEQIYSTQPTLTAEDIAASVEYVLAAPAHVQVHDVLIRPTEQMT